MRSGSHASGSRTRRSPFRPRALTGRKATLCESWDSTTNRYRRVRNDQNGAPRSSRHVSVLFLSLFSNQTWLYGDSSIIRRVPQQHRYPGRGLHGELVHRIGLDIVSGRLEPGDVVPASESDDESQASRTVFREVIKVLTAKGLVESKQRVGTRVRSRRFWNLLDQDVLAWQLESGSRLQSFAEVAELRLLIEPAAARMAAERATKVEVKKLRSAYRRMDEAASDATLDAFLTADVEFHQTILTSCHNELIEQLASILRNIFRLSFSISAHMRVQSLSMHEVILIAIEDNDPLAAESAMRALITKTIELVEREDARNTRRTRKRTPTTNGQTSARSSRTRGR
jgi:GntR family galactonate operon transcriptional repressor